MIARPRSFPVEDIAHYRACLSIDAKLKDIARNFTECERVEFAITTPEEITPQLEFEIRRTYQAVGWREMYVTSRGRSETSHITTWWISV